MTGTNGPDPDDVRVLTELLDLMVFYGSNEQRARYLLSSNWMRDRGAAAAEHLRRRTATYAPNGPLESPPDDLTTAECPSCGGESSEVGFAPGEFSADEYEYECMTCHWQFHEPIREHELPDHEAATK